MAQQTAVEWLVEQYANENYGIEVYEQAKQMEKEEKKKVIIKSWQDGFDTGNYISTTTGGWNGNGEDYYNETYGCKHDWRKMNELTANIYECRKCGIQQSNHLP